MTRDYIIHGRCQKIVTEKQRKWISITLKIIFIIIIVSYFEWWGVWGVLGYYIISSIYACWVGRDHILRVKHYIESAIWGKPLKDFEKGQKFPKVEIVWRKKKNGKRRSTN